MLVRIGAQSVPLLTQTQALRRRCHWPIAASTNDWLITHSSIGRISSSLRLAILDRQTFSCSTPDAIVDKVQIWWIRGPQCWRNEVGHISLQDSDGVSCSMPVHRSVERHNPFIPYQDYVALGKKIVTIVCPFHFDTQLEKMDFSAAINKLLFKHYVKM